MKQKSSGMLVANRFVFGTLGPWVLTNEILNRAGINQGFGFAAHHGVIVFLDCDCDARVFELIDSIPVADRKELIAIGESKGSITIICTPQHRHCRIKGGVDAPGDWWSLYLAIDAETGEDITKFE